MSHKNYLLVGFAIAFLTFCALPVKAQFEFGPTAGVGAVMDKPIQASQLATPSSRMLPSAYSFG